MHTLAQLLRYVCIRMYLWLKRFARVSSLSLPQDWWCGSCIDSVKWAHTPEPRFPLMQSGHPAPLPSLREMGIMVTQSPWLTDTSYTVGLVFADLTFMSGHALIVHFTEGHICIEQIRKPGCRSKHSNYWIKAATHSIPSPVWLEQKLPGLGHWSHGTNTGNGGLLWMWQLSDFYYGCRSSSDYRIVKELIGISLHSECHSINCLGGIFKFKGWMTTFRHICIR